MAAKIYSLDLGIDGDLPLGYNGNHPLQAGLCSGTIEKNVFLPKAIASWQGLESGDQVIVRVFNITLGTGDGWSISGSIAPDFIFRETFSCLPSPPWEIPDHGGAFREQAGNTSPCFPVPASLHPGPWPCYVPQLADGTPVTYPIKPVGGRQWFLMTICLSIELSNGNRYRFVEDPEMVVSPDSDGELSGTR